MAINKNIATYSLNVREQEEPSNLSECAVTEYFVFNFAGHIRVTISSVQVGVVHQVIISKRKLIDEGLWIFQGLATRT